MTYPFLICDRRGCAPRVSLYAKYPEVWSSYVLHNISDRRGCAPRVVSSYDNRRCRPHMTYLICDRRGCAPRISLCIISGGVVLIGTLSI